MDTTVVVSLVVATTVIVIAVIVCTGLLYNKYIRWFKVPSVNPAQNLEPQPGNTPVVGRETNAHDMEVAKENGGSHAETRGSEVPYHSVKLPDGRVITPQICISQEMLSMYRMLWQNNGKGLMEPPSKVQQLYSEDTMVLFHRDLKNTFQINNSPQQTGSKITCSQSHVNPGLTLTEERDLVTDLRLAVDPLKTENHRKNNSIGKTEDTSPDVKDTCTSDTRNAPESVATVGTKRPVSGRSYNSEETKDYLIRPGDVELGDF